MVRAYVRVVNTWSARAREKASEIRVREGERKRDDLEVEETPDGEKGTRQVRRL